MQRKCLSRMLSENLKEFSLCGRDMSCIVCRHRLCRYAGCICTLWFSIHSPCGALRRNIQEPGFKTGRHNRAIPHRRVLPSCLSVSVAVIQGSPQDTLLLQLPLLLLAYPSSAWGRSHSIGNPLNPVPESARWQSGQFGLVILHIERPLE
jgi:hypothetical protein